MVSRDGFISIHAPHARSDVLFLYPNFRKRDFNPRSSCEERRMALMIMTLRIYFNPRSSCEERRMALMIMTLRIYFNPRSSCEERPRWMTQNFTLRYFNPRSSCEERPSSRLHSSHADTDFNPRSSCEERLADLHPHGNLPSLISIHAPHARSDGWSWRVLGG